MKFSFVNWPGFIFPDRNIQTLYQCIPACQQSELISQLSPGPSIGAQYSYDYVFDLFLHRCLSQQESFFLLLPCRQLRGKFGKFSTQASQLEIRARDNWKEERKEEFLSLAFVRTMFACVVQNRSNSPSQSIREIIIEETLRCQFFDGARKKGSDGLVSSRSSQPRTNDHNQTEPKQNRIQLSSSAPKFFFHSTSNSILNSSCFEHV